MKKEEFKSQEEFMSQEEGFLESFEEYMKQNLERIGCGTPFINREIKKRKAIITIIS